MLVVGKGGGCGGADTELYMGVDVVVGVSSWAIIMWKLR